MIYYNFIYFIFPQKYCVVYLHFYYKYILLNNFLLINIHFKTML